MYVYFLCVYYIEVYIRFGLTHRYMIHWELNLHMHELSFFVSLCSFCFCIWILNFQHHLLQSLFFPLELLCISAEIH